MMMRPSAVASSLGLLLATILGVAACDADRTRVTEFRKLSLTQSRGTKGSRLLTSHFSLFLLVRSRS
jgi:hypothetical protein